MGYILGYPIPAYLCSLYPPRRIVEISLLATSSHRQGEESYPLLND